MDRLVGWLGQLRDQLAAMRRRRSPVEATPALTAAYRDLLFAVGFARLGAADRARALVADARASVEAQPEVRDDAIHPFLLAAFAARVDQAIAGVPARRQLPAALLAQLADLQRTMRYKVERLRETSHLLEPSPPGALDVFSGRRRESIAPAREPAEAAVRARELEARVDDAESIVGEPRANRLAACLDELLELPQGLAVPILARIVVLAEPSAHPALLADTMTVAAWFGWGELVPGPLRALRRLLAEPAGAGELGAAIIAGLRALRALELRPELTDLTRELEPLIDHSAGVEIGGVADIRVQAQVSAARLRFAYAGSLVYLGDPRGAEVFEAGRAELARAKHFVFRGKLLRAIAAGYTFAPLDDALAGLEHLIPQFANVTDMSGSNTHFCISVLDFVDSLVHAVVELAPLRRRS